MTTATDRRARTRGGAVRCTRAVVIALLAAFAILIHHDTTSAAMPARAMSAMAGMDHPSATLAMTTSAASTGQGAWAASAGHGTALQATHTAMDDSGACPGPAMQHCSSGDVTAAKLTPPPAAAHIGWSDTPYGVVTGQGLGMSHRAPPDLSLLSRLLI
jgi:hypothetical protein